MPILTKATHKKFLYDLFMENGKNRRMPLNKLKVAATAIKKLLDGSTDDTDGKIRFIVSDADFTTGEWAVLKWIFNAKTEGTIDEAPVIEELTAMFV